jgi:hypothetical protein
LVAPSAARYDTDMSGLPLRYARKRSGIAILGTLNADAS